MAADMSEAEYWRRRALASEKLVSETHDLMVTQQKTFTEYLLVLNQEGSGKPEGEAE